MGQLVAVRNEAVLKSNISVLGHTKTKLAFHFDGGEAGRASLNDEGLDAATVLLVTSPNDDVAHRGISDPALLSIEDPTAFSLACRCFESRGITAIARLRQAKTENLFKLNSWGQEALFLFVIAEGIDDGHTNSVVNQEESCDRAISLCELVADSASLQGRHTWATIALDLQAIDAKWSQLVR